MNTATVTPTQSTPAINNNSPKHGEFGGKYANACNEVYTFLTKQYGLDAAKSHKIAHMFACEHGAAMKNATSEHDFKTGKRSKEGKLTLKETVSSTAKNVNATAAMEIAHAIQWAGDAGKHGMSFGNTEWSFNDELTKWINELEA